MRFLWLNANGCEKPRVKMDWKSHQEWVSCEREEEKTTRFGAFRILARARDVFNNFKYHAVPIILIYLYCSSYLCECRRIYLVAAPCFVLCTMWFFFSLHSFSALYTNTYTCSHLFLLKAFSLGRTKLTSKRAKKRHTVKEKIFECELAHSTKAIHIHKLRHLQPFCFAAPCLELVGCHSPTFDGTFFHFMLAHNTDLLLLN